MPDVPNSPQREGSRWRYHRPDGEEVAAWFSTQPLDEGMKHEDFVSGVVIIPASEKVKVQRRDGRGTEDRYEMTYTPYVRVDTRISYFRKLAAARGEIAVIEPVAVPRMPSGEAYNGNLPEGFWWHVVRGDGQSFVRYLCCTMRVALYREEDYFAEAVQTNPSGTWSRHEAKPLREGRSTKQVVASTSDVNALAKAETGAIGRALGVAGILVIGTGLATAEDMAELRGGEAAEAPALPAVEARASADEINARLVALQAQMTAEAPGAWQEFAAWWTERKEAEGWANLSDAPIEVRRGMIARMESMLASASEAQPAASPDSSSGE